jgi:mRNA-degrading endonuclease YafQ of YafQ-DinJ toxin-antitoxin module
MKLTFAPSYLRDYQHLPQRLQKQTDRKLALLLQNPFHPSLRTKKVKGEVLGLRDVYEGSISMNYRFLFRVTPKAYELLRVGTHTQIFGR